MTTAREVFTPGTRPTHTYVRRDQGRFEQQLRDGLDTPGIIVSLAGPSKSGKTVLVEKVVGAEYLIPVSGAGIQHPGQVWTEVLDWMDAPHERRMHRSSQQTFAFDVEGGGKLAVPLTAEGSAKVRGGVKGRSGCQEVEVSRRRGLLDVAEEIANSDFVVFLDDFHYMARAVQEEVARQFKDAAYRGVRICTAHVPHRADDMVRANPELRGRLLAVDLPRWTIGQLEAIAQQGFPALNLAVEPDLPAFLSTEAAGSPQLMQALCLNSCFAWNVRTRLPKPRVIRSLEMERQAICTRTARATDFRSFAEVVVNGPKTRGQDRNQYRHKDGQSGDVYKTIFKAIAMSPPTLSFDYDSLTQRIAEVCIERPPSGSSISGSCDKIHELATTRFPAERIIEWDDTKDVLDLVEPYFLFYLRWSGFLTESKRSGVV